MIRPRFFVTAGLATALVCNSVIAHEGHGHTPSSTPAHYIAEPIHLAQIAVIAVVVCLPLVAWLCFKAYVRKSA